MLPTKTGYGQRDAKPKIMARRETGPQSAGSGGFGDWALKGGHKGKFAPTGVFSDGEKQLRILGGAGGREMVGWTSKGEKQLGKQSNGQPFGQTKNVALPSFS